MVLLLGKHEVVEVVETLDTVIATENVKAVLYHLSSMTESGRGCLVESLLEVGIGHDHCLDLLLLGRLLALDCGPEVFVDFELVEVRSRVTCATSEQKD